MTSTVHQRPGVYSSYDASSIVGSGNSAKTIGIAAAAVSGDKNAVTYITSYETGVSAFGLDGGTPGMSTLLKLAFLNGATRIAAVAVGDGDYASAFALLAQEEDIGIMLCDSAELTVQQALRDSVHAASEARRERIAIVGSSAETVAQLTARAAEINSERTILVGPDVLDTGGNTMPSVFAAAALAGVIASSSDPAIPINGAELSGLGGIGETYDDNDIDALVTCGVTPLECVAGAVSAVRGITTRTLTGGASDTTWREMTTILIVDDVIPTIRSSLRAKFSRSKNTEQNRGAIRSCVIVELENFVSKEIIDGYDSVTVRADTDDPTTCVVEFSFAVAHGLNRIYLTAHITV
ncbi:MAG: phage tail sheath C-terminal domain-containing protein [Oscillospiraceae bacterium]|nr:phage tail sheath C-terminal domain-containing protein [Oscillospiraceae bacterium]